MAALTGMRFSFWARKKLVSLISWVVKGLLERVTQGGVGGERLGHRETDRQTDRDRDRERQRETETERQRLYFTKIVVLLQSKPLKKN